MVKKRAKDPMVFLNDGRIMGIHHVPFVDYFKPNAHLELKKFGGMDRVEQQQGIYHVLASAAKYLADIALYGDPDEIRSDEPITKPIQERSLFEGGIQIYKDGEIEGHGIRGYELIAVGRIHFATPTTEEFTMGDGLHKVVFGNATTPEQISARLEAIARGYKHQKRETASMYVEMGESTANLADSCGGGRNFLRGFRGV